MIEDLASDGQRWDIFQLFGELGVGNMEQMRADIRRILKLDYLADLRELTGEDADRLIGELRADLARKRVSNE